MSGHIFCVHKGAHAWPTHTLARRPWIDAYKGVFGRQRDSPSGPTEGRPVLDSISFAVKSVIVKSFGSDTQSSRLERVPFSIIFRLQVGSPCISAAVPTI